MLKSGVNLNGDSGQHLFSMLSQPVPSVLVLLWPPNNAREDGRNGSLEHLATVDILPMAKGRGIHSKPFAARAAGATNPHS